MQSNPILPHSNPFVACAAVLLSVFLTFAHVEAELANVSGVYPHLTMYNSEGECGTGAVVPWAGRLWVITYAPHKPMGSSDKLYEITPELEQIVRPESIGGTPANRMIHKESRQLNIGPYFIDADRRVRVVPCTSMPGRLTGTARHLHDPANRIHIATMEEGLYSVDVHSLAVEEHIRDGNPGIPRVGDVPVSTLAGAHGKGLYTGQGRVIYANNGEPGNQALKDPAIPAGALGEWSGSGNWQLVRRNQFTEVTGPGGIMGNAGDDDPVWSMGWDHRSLILMVLHDGAWHAYRLPKGSHSYDGAHGWNTEWPRIREVGEVDLLATMHGTFWRFPKDFAPGHAGGIEPRSNYLKVIGDFAAWQGRIVFGCDDSAEKEFLNVRELKSKTAGPRRSNSNLWFVEPRRLDALGPVIGRGAVWLRDDVKAGQTSDPYLFSGYDYRMLTIAHGNAEAVEFDLEVDADGTGEWGPLCTLSVGRSLLHMFGPDDRGAWVRVRCRADAKKVSVHFQYRDADRRLAGNAGIFSALAQVGEAWDSHAVLRSNGEVLGVAAGEAYYALDANLALEKVESPADREWVRAAQPPEHVIDTDAASVIVVEDGRRYRLPRHGGYDDGPVRICREVVTERDLMNCHGTFYELPARNAGGFAKIRPIATHQFRIYDYASHAGLLFFSGVRHMEHARLLRSGDGKVALWAGVIDDLWQLGKPRGEGGPWKDHAVKAGVPSDPYLMTAYDRKSVRLGSSVDNSVTIEVDVDGTGLWVPYRTFDLKAGTMLEHEFPVGLSAYWCRAISTQDAVVTVWLTYR